MARKGPPKGHTGRAEKGYTADLKVESIGRVTIYKRGRTCYLQHREEGKTVRDAGGRKSQHRPPSGQRREPSIR